MAYLIGKLKYFIPSNVITKMNHAINVKIALKTKFAVKTDCILKPDIKDNDKKNKPTPSNLNTIL